MLYLSIFVYLGIVMKKLALFIGCMSLATAGFCGVGEFSDSTTCYIYKQDKLQKQLKCSYEGVEGAASSYGFRQVSYTLPGFGTMNTSTSVDGFDSKGQATGVTTTLNDEPAVIRYRLPKNKSIVSDKYAQSDKVTLECYLSTKSKWEICT